MLTCYTGNTCERNSCVPCVVERITAHHRADLLLRRTNLAIAMFAHLVQKQIMTESTFGALGVPTPLIAVLDKAGITSPFPIQEDTLPDTLRGRDVLGRGKTGSGKTLAFSIPMVARLSNGGRRQSGRPRGLILAPTRELATQITATLAPLADAYGMTVTTIFGGISQARQVAALKAGVDIVVACPGRLEDLMQQKFLTLDAVEITVLDEADHMADLGFLPVVTRILNKTPDGGQRMLFSATLDNGVDKIVKRYLHDEILHSVDDVTSHVEAMTHHVFEVDGVDAKRDLVQALASGTGRRILFMRTKHHAKKLARQLIDSGIPSVDLHGNLSQPQRDRNLAAFSAGDVSVLVATDVAARGIDIGNVELVVHVDPPAEHKAYLHRSGRTARAGSARRRRLGIARRQQPARHQVGAVALSRGAVGRAGARRRQLLAPGCAERSCPDAPPDSPGGRGRRLDRRDGARQAWARC